MMNCNDINDKKEKKRKKEEDISVLRLEYMNPNAQY